MRQRPAYLIALVVGLSPGVACAAQESYSCKTEDGRTLTGEVPPPECARRELRVLAPDGRLLRVIPAPETPEQRQQREREEKRKRDEDAAKLEQKRQDKALLDTYSSVSEIEAARRRALEGLQRRTKAIGERLDDLQKERKRLDNEMEFYATHTPPDQLKRALNANAASVKDQQKAVRDVEAEIDRVNKFFDLQVKRFRELRPDN